MIIHQHLEQNTTGTDYAVGDIHGSFSVLQDKLNEIGFDPNKDRLIAVGDLVDRGSESHLVKEWLTKPWFYSVMGNHDHQIVHYATNRVNKDWYRAHGGNWFLKLQHGQRLTYCDALAKLPLVITIDTPYGKVGVVHAEVQRNDWNQYMDELNQRSFEAIHLADMSMWGFEKYVKANTEIIKNIDLIIHGHMTVHEPLRLGNRIYIDTGMGYITAKGYPTVFNITKNKVVGE